ncbi:helix-turn-helix domain-containing protein [Streptomyces sp. NPDC053493]|uniref:helix-turn-helix domain-containing protein n=1 Tax=Streptomyces sp. NPDC053493 TaxID=3365705 RepID=UPI0037D4B12C
MIDARQILAGVAVTGLLHCWRAAHKRRRRSNELSKMPHRLRGTCVAGMAANTSRARDTRVPMRCSRARNPPSVAARDRAPRQGFRACRAVSQEALTRARHGTHENPVDHSVPSRGELADFLRAERRASGLTYDHLAERTGISAATLKRAASSRVTPRVDPDHRAVDSCLPKTAQPRTHLHLVPCLNDHFPPSRATQAPDCRCRPASSRPVRRSAHRQMRDPGSREADPR